MEVRLPRGRVLKIEVGVSRREAAAPPAQPIMDPEVEAVLRRGRQKLIREAYEGRAAQGDA